MDGSAEASMSELLGSCRPQQAICAPTVKPAPDDYLFISYAWEDRVLADWLMLRLTAAGYRVWCDRFKIFGGENWPLEIDDVIKNQTFRVLALISTHSKEKANPLKERTLALSIAKERKSDFLIPLNVDQLKPTELSWMLSDLNFIPFHDWGEGLGQLEKKLKSINAPRPLLDDGRTIVANLFSPSRILQNVPERIDTNTFRFSELPSKLLIVKFPRPLNAAQKESLSLDWAFSSASIDSPQAFAFSPPPSERGLDYEIHGVVPWQDMEAVNSIPTANIVTHLLRQSLDLYLLSRGLLRNVHTKQIYFPKSLLPKDKLQFRNPSGRRVSLLATGSRKFGGTRYLYHLAPKFIVKQITPNEYVAQLKTRVFLTDPSGNLLEYASANARRKKLAKSWFNHHWYHRQLAITEYLFEGNSSVQLIPSSNGNLRLFTVPISGMLPIGINEAITPGQALSESDVSELIDYDDDNE